MVLSSIFVCVFIWMKAKDRFKHGVPPNLEVITLVSIQHINPENNIITHLMTSALEQHTQTHTHTKFTEGQK